MSDLVLEDIQFSLPTPDGGTYTFGRPGLDEAVILTGGWDLGSTTVKDQDAQPSGSDRTTPGRDFLTAPSWTFSLLVARDGDVTGALDRLMWAWRGGDTRLTPGALVPLRYARSGAQRVVYGRPRKIDIEPPDTWSDDFALVTAEFKLMDPTVYGQQRSRLLTLTQPSRSEWVWGQFAYPWRPRFGVRDRPGFVDVGTAPVSFTVTFTGDSAQATSGVTLVGPGWKIALRDKLQPGQVVVVDTRTLMTTVDGVRAAPLTADSTLRATLTGVPEISLYADATTGATALVEWRPGYMSI